MFLHQNQKANPTAEPDQRRVVGHGGGLLLCLYRAAYGTNGVSNGRESSNQKRFKLFKRMKWYYVENGQQTGPVEETEFPQLMQSGKLRTDTMVWHDGMANWEPFGKVGPKEQTAAMPAPAPGTEAVCAECGGLFNQDEMISIRNMFICAKCKPVFMQKLAEGAKLNTGELNYAGFGIRFAAKFLDGLLLGIVLYLPLFIFIASRAGQQSPGEFDVVTLVLQLGFYGISMIYSIFFLGKYGATPGKMACKIKVVTADGGKIGYGRATGRFFAELLSGMICYIGYIMVAFDKEQRRSLHDHMCNTRVIYK